MSCTAKDVQKHKTNDTKSKPKKKNTKTPDDKSTDISPNTDDSETLAVQIEKKPPPKRKARSNKSDDKNNTETLQTTQEEPLKKEPKPKKEPLMPPGEWVAPEMEIALNAIHDRLKMTIGTNTNRMCGDNVSLVEETKIPEFEDSDNNLPKIDVDKVLVRLSNGEVYESPRYDALFLFVILLYKNSVCWCFCFLIFCVN